MRIFSAFCVGPARSLSASVTHLIFPLRKKGHGKWNERGRGGGKKRCNKELETVSWGEVEFWVSLTFLFENKNDL